MVIPEVKKLINVFQMGRDEVHTLFTMFNPSLVWLKGMKAFSYIIMCNYDTDVERNGNYLVGCTRSADPA